MSISDEKIPNSNRNGLNIIIVDDEVKSSENISNMLHKFVDPDINIIGLANNTATAEQLISKFPPDAILLDIEMPNENAFHFLDRISPIDFEVIFITAYDKYAIRAIKLNAIDYILKPISIHELQNAIYKLKEKIKDKKLISGLSTTYEDPLQKNSTESKINNIILKDANHYEILEQNDIFFVEAQRSYSKISFRKKNTISEIVMSHPLAYYEELLAPNLFYRVHKSYLINCQHIDDITVDDNCSIVLKNKHEISISRRRYNEFMKFLKENNFHVA